MLKKLCLEKGVGAVDMEFSALCAVAKFRKIQFAAVLIVSDELWGDSWRPGFSKQFFIEQKQAALKLLLDHIGRLWGKIMARFSSYQSWLCEKFSRFRGYAWFHGLCWLGTG